MVVWSFFIQPALFYGAYANGRFEGSDSLPSAELMISVQTLLTLLELLITCELLRLGFEDAEISFVRYTTLQDVRSE